MKKLFLILALFPLSVSAQQFQEMNMENNGENEKNDGIYAENAGLYGKNQ